MSLLQDMLEGAETLPLPTHPWAWRSTGTWRARDIHLPRD